MVMLRNAITVLTVQPTFMMYRRGGREGYNTLLNTDLRCGLHAFLLGTASSAACEEPSWQFLIRLSSMPFWNRSYGLPLVVAHAT